MTTSGIEVDHSTLEIWKKNYQDNKPAGFPLNSASISLEQLETFIAEAKQKYSSPAFNSIKIYFIRYAITSSDDNIFKEPDKDFSHPSLVFVPIKNDDLERWTGDDFKLANGKIFVLPFCNPENPANNRDETGLNPPKGTL